MKVQAGISKRTDFPLEKSKAALLVIDVQTFCCPKDDSDFESYYGQSSFPQMLTNIPRLTKAFRNVRDTSSQGCEVVFTYIQTATKDGRDMSLDYKLSGPAFLKIPRVNDSLEEIFLDSVFPSNSGKGDILIPKTACSVFNSTNIDYMLRNLQVEQLVVCGQLTEQCVESAVRDAADKGYLVSVVQDACAAHSEERHEQGLRGMAGFCRLVETQTVLAELS